MSLIEIINILILIILALIAFLGKFLWDKVNCVDRKLSNHLTSYTGQISEVNTTLKFFKEHFKEIDEAIKKKKNKC